MVESDEFEICNIAEIPDSLLRAITQLLLPHCVSLFCEHEGSSDRWLQYCGSGTLVAVGQRRYVLTAEHVWAELDMARSVGISLSPGPEPLVIPRAQFTGVVVGVRGSFEWGPDLALLQLPSSQSDQLARRKSFYSLDKQPSNSLDDPPNYELGLWAVVGVPEELSEFTSTSVTLQVRTYVSGVDSYNDREGFDYVELGIDERGQPDLPRTYNGLSGAGLWQIMAGRSRSTGQFALTGHYSLEGVTFYEEIRPSGKGFLRCHGRRSVYVHAVAATQPLSSIQTSSGRNS